MFLNTLKKLNCILLIDDNPADNEYLTIKLKKVGVCDHVHIATSGTQALTYVTESGDANKSEEFPKPDLIYLDINMPGMGGFEFLKEYEKLDERLKTKVIIMLSTSLNPNDKKRADENKLVSEFQNKPLTIDMLFKTLEKYF